MAEYHAGLPHWHALITARRDAGETRVGFCRRVQVSHSYMVDLEKGRRHGTEPVLKRVADYFGITVTELLDSRTDGGVITPRRPSLKRRAAA